MADDYPFVTIESVDEWRNWLEANHATSPGIWLVTWEQGSGRAMVAWDAIVDDALCYGWVDSRPRAIDATRSARLLTPRKATSNWSARNKRRVEALTAEGRMEPAGLAAVHAAKANGRWSALDEVETLSEPPDLAAALDSIPNARRHWDAFPRSARRAILEWIAGARTEATRQSRIKRTVSDASQNIRANQWRQPKTGGTSPS